MLFIIGLGLGDAKDITVKGLEKLKSCKKIYLESYTSLLFESSQEDLEQFYGKELILADREKVEQEADEILNEAKNENVAFLVVGDPFGATTHTDLVLRARKLNIPYEVIHNASILTAVGSSGLQLYNFGETVSIPFWTDTWKPDSFFDKIMDNKKRGLHTLCLLDIKVKEPNLECMMRGKTVYDPPRFMSVSQAAKQILEIINNKGDKGFIKEDVDCIGLARIGSKEEKIVYSTMDKIQDIDMGPPLHSLIIPGVLHPLESEFLKIFGNE